jgi:hypothetical protein
VSTKSPTNLDVALFVQREKHRLSERHHDFIDHVVKTLNRSPRLTRKQAEYLYVLFYELGEGSRNAPNANHSAHRV